MKVMKIFGLMMVLLLIPVGFEPVLELVRGMLLI
jgi:hypothetical protein